MILFCCCHMAELVVEKADTFLQQQVFSCCTIQISHPTTRFVRTYSTPSSSDNNIPSACTLLKPGRAGRAFWHPTARLHAVTACLRVSGFSTPGLSPFKRAHTPADTLPREACVREASRFDHFVERPSIRAGLRSEGGTAPPGLPPAYEEVDIEDTRLPDSPTLAPVFNRNIPAEPSPLFNAYNWCSIRLIEPRFDANSTRQATWPAHVPLFSQPSILHQVNNPTPAAKLNSTPAQVNAATGSTCATAPPPVNLPANLPVTPGPRCIVFLCVFLPPHLPSPILPPLLVILGTVALNNVSSSFSCSQSHFYLLSTRPPVRLARFCPLATTSTLFLVEQPSPPPPTLSFALWGRIKLLPPIPGGTMEVTGVVNRQTGVHSASAPSPLSINVQVTATYNSGSAVLDILVDVVSQHGFQLIRVRPAADANGAPPVGGPELEDLTYDLCMLTIVDETTPCKRPSPSLGDGPSTVAPALRHRPTANALVKPPFARRRTGQQLQEMTRKRRQMLGALYRADVEARESASRLAFHQFLLSNVSDPEPNPLVARPPPVSSGHESVPSRLPRHRAESRFQHFAQQRRVRAGIRNRGDIHPPPYDKDSQDAIPHSPTVPDYADLAPVSDRHIPSPMPTVQRVIAPRFDLGQAPPASWPAQGHSPCRPTSSPSSPRGSSPGKASSTSLALGTSINGMITPPSTSSNLSSALLVLQEYESDEDDNGADDEADDDGAGYESDASATSSHNQAADDDGAGHESDATSSTIHYTEAQIPFIWVINCACLPAVVAMNVTPEGSANVPAVEAVIANMTSMAITQVASPGEGKPGEQHDANAVAQHQQPDTSKLANPSPRMWPTPPRLPSHITQAAETKAQVNIEASTAEDSKEQSEPLETAPDHTLINTSFNKAHTPIAPTIRRFKRRLEEV
ncbi:uncharacterized protein EHS24_008061 [Apiotrichum porosum]|uniref:Uncharacterized protein n=1 Tax=Apiotrichum porosum TaxID=105984 RepID=A0A427XSM7_9TREE|nr:uncharacterized protein EHS24_008061 [Apiotrichum porosum]RSH81866.1 hypothetical protein EHS24_008061 [Apiotrichum porosum]